MRADEDQRFAAVMSRFLEKQCVKGAEYSISDEDLFARFREFWINAPEQFDHTALLGQFRVELEQRGFYASPDGKHPNWRGLTVRE
jgi:hypothetical protein